MDGNYMKEDFSMAGKTRTVLMSCWILLFLGSFGRGVLALPLPVEWPDPGSGWSPLPDPCASPPFTGIYTEPHDDFPGSPSFHQLDIVGSASYPAGFRASDGTHLMLRMRIDKFPTGSGPNTQFVWQFLLDTDLDANGYVDWSLQLDQKVDNHVEFVPASPGGPLFAQVNLSHNETDGHWSGDLADFSRIILDTGDGGELGDTGLNDSFIDLAIPWADFTVATGLGEEDSFGVYLTTSNSHIQVVKDVPDCGEAAADPDPDPAAIPEPASLTLLGLGLLAVLRRRRN